MWVLVLGLVLGEIDIVVGDPMSGKRVVALGMGIEGPLVDSWGRGRERDREPLVWAGIPGPEERVLARGVEQGAG